MATTKLYITFPTKCLFSNINFVKGHFFPMAYNEASIL